MHEATSTAKFIFNFIMIFLSSVFTYLDLNGETMGLYILLQVIDYITGIYKANALNESITSNKMKYGAASKLLLLLIPFSLAIAAKAIEMDVSIVLSWSITILILSEVYSIIGNIYAARTKQELPEYDAVAMIGKKVRDFMIKIAKSS